MNYTNPNLIDPVFTKLAHGYTMPRLPVAEFIAPIVPVDSRTGTVVQFGKDDFTITDTKRAPGSSILRQKATYGASKFSLSQDALAAEVPFEHVEQGKKTGLNQLKQVNLNKVLNQLALGWENEVLTLVTNSDNFEPSLVGTVANKWDTNSSNPQLDIFDAGEAIRAQSAIYPNSMVMGPDVYKKLLTNEYISERFKYTSGGNVSLDVMANFFGLTRGIRVATHVKEENGAFVDIMPPKTVLLFYSPPTTSTGTLSGQAVDSILGNPSFCYTYTLRESPIVTPFREDLDRRVYVADVLMDKQAVITSIGQTGKAGAAYLLTNVIS